MTLDCLTALFRDMDKIIIADQVPGQRGVGSSRGLFANPDNIPELHGFYKNGAYISHYARTCNRNQDRSGSLWVQALRDGNGIPWHGHPL